LKRLALALAALAALAPAGCGGDEEAAPAGLEQRVASSEDAPGWEADPVETGVVVANAEEFVSELGHAFINPTDEETAELKESSFVRAVDDTLFKPAESGGAHTSEAPHLHTMVIEFGSEQDAQRAVEFLHTDSIRPCPETCASQAEEFEVDGVDDAQGTHRFATADAIEETGDDVEPFDSYELQFTDGVFAYRIELRGPPGSVSEEEVEEIAGRLYDRVTG
jgi:hypothetical protein